MPLFSTGCLVVLLLLTKKITKQTGDPKIIVIISVQALNAAQKYVTNVSVFKHFRQYFEND